MTLDAHQHFWHYDAARHTWMDDSMTVIQRDFMPADLMPELQANGIEGCVAVQADQTEAETHFLLQLAGDYSFIKKVVGWVDLRSSAVEARLHHFSDFEKLAGFRHIVQSEPDVDFLLRKDFCHGIASLEKHGFTYDLLVFPRHLPAVLQLVQRFPRQKFVIDHLAKPAIRTGRFDDWAALMRSIAQHENVWYKVSGLVTEAHWHSWRYEDFVPYLDLVAETFGPQRLLFGSDWPVCLLAGSYGEVLSIVQQYFQHFSSTEKNAVMGGNAAKFYTRI